MYYLSIITVNKNNHKGLERTINSVREQSFTDYQFIIIDGASNDKSLSIIENNSEGIDYWISEDDNGVYHAMNKGLIKAKGKYCLFLNSGDYLVHKNILQEIYDLKIKEDIFSGAIYKYYSDGEVVEKFSRINNSNFTLKDIINSSLNHQATFTKRSLFNEYGFYDENYKIISDWVFILRVLVMGKASFKYIDKVICYYEPQGISSNKEYRLYMETLPALREYIPPRILADYISYMTDENLILLEKIKKIKKNKLGSMLIRFLFYCSKKYGKFVKKKK